MLSVGNLSTGSLKKLKKIIQTLLPRNNHFLGICHYILTFALPLLPLRIYVLKVLNMCGRGPAQEKAMSTWKTKCVRGTQKEEGTALVVHVNRLLVARPINE